MRTGRTAARAAGIGSKRSGSRTPASTVRMGSAARRWTSARPMPRLAPVTRAVAPSRSMAGDYGWGTSSEIRSGPDGKAVEVKEKTPKRRPGRALPGTGPAGVRRTASAPAKRRMSLM